MGFLGIFLRKKRSGEGGAPALREGDPFREAISFAEERGLWPQLTSLSGEKILEISPRLESVERLLNEKGASLVARLGEPRERGVSILSRWENLPFLDASWDYLLVRSALMKGNPGGLGRLIREAGRVLKPGGTLLFSDFHPFSPMIQREHLKNPVGEEGMGPGFERYFKMFREGGFKIEWVKEVFFEGSLRKFFTSLPDKKTFDDWRKTPFMIFFVLSKG